MTELICDICGTSYPDTASKCPTCGYSRVVDVLQDGTGSAHAEHEKVRGGRYSRKNVRRRISEQEKAEAPIEEAEEAAEPVKYEPEPEPVPVPDPEQLKAFRRDVALNLILTAALLVFLAAGGYLLVSYGIPYLRALIG